MNMNELLENKINELIKSIRNGRIEKMNAYDQFHGYTKALVEFGIITKETAVEYRLGLQRVLF